MIYMRVHLRRFDFKLRLRNSVQNTHIIIIVISRGPSHYATNMPLPSDTFITTFEVVFRSRPHLSVTGFDDRRSMTFDRVQPNSSGVLCFSFFTCEVGECLLGLTLGRVRLVATKLVGLEFHPHL